MKRRRWLVCICLLGLTAGCAKPAPRSKTVMVSRTGVLYRTQSQVLFFCGTAMANIKTVAALQQYFKAGKTVHIDPHEPTLQAWDLPSPPAFKGRFAKATIKTRTPVPQATRANYVTTKITLADHASLPKLTIDQLIWQ